MEAEANETGSRTSPNLGTMEMNRSTKGVETYMKWGTGGGNGCTNKDLSIYGSET